MTADELRGWAQAIGVVVASIFALYVPIAAILKERRNYDKAATPTPHPTGQQALQPLAALYVDQAAISSFTLAVERLTLAMQQSAVATNNKADETGKLADEFHDLRKVLEDFRRRGTRPDEL